MDALDVALGGVLSQIANGSLGEAGARLWDSLSNVVRRTLRSGDVEMSAVLDGPLDESEISEVTSLLVRLSSEDPNIRRGLLAWIEEAGRVERGEVVQNTVYGSVSGKIVQARDVGSVQM